MPEQVSRTETTCERSYMEKEWNQNLAGNEAHYTSSMKCLVKNMLYSELHCQKGFDLVNFSYQVLHKGDPA